MISPFRRAGVALACAGLVLLPTVGSPAVAAEKEDVRKVLDARGLNDRSRPAVMLIESDFAAQVSAPEVEIDSDLLGKDLANDPAFQALFFADDEAGQQAYAIKKFLAAPAKYLKAGAARRKDVSIVATGSGFAVTPDGYVVTNAHVVDPGEAELKQQLITIGLKEVIAQDSKEIIAELKGFPSTDVQRVLDALVAFTVANARIGEVKKQYFTAVGKAVPGVVKTAKGTPAELVDKGEPYPGKDVAILKIQSATPLITLPIGDEAQHEPGDKIYAIGYPADATFSSGTTSGSELEPTLTEGPISAKKTTDAGVPILQTQTPIAPGSSGGPALDDRGLVIGLTTAGITGTQGFNFVMPASIVKDFLNRKNIVAKDGPATDLWEKGLEEASEKHYKKSLKTFNELNTIAPGSPYVQAKIADSQTRISAGENVDESSFPLIPVAIGAGLLVLLLVGGGIGLSRKGKKKGGEALPVYGTPGPTGTVAAPPPGTYGAPQPQQYSEPPAYSPPPSAPPVYTPPPPSAPPPPPTSGFPTPPPPSAPPPPPSGSSFPPPPPNQ